MPFTRSDKANTVINELLTRGIINTYNFSITEDILYEYRKTYAALRDGYENDTLRTRRYAALSLLDFKKEHNIKITEGFIYFITNPAWPDKLKIGLSADYEKRLASYQTYDPYRAYKIVGVDFVENSRQAEKLLLNKFKVDTDKGEWVSYDSHIEIIRYLRSFINIKPLAPWRNR